MTATFEVTAIEFPLMEGTLGKPCIRFQSPHIAYTHSLNGCTQVPFIFAFGHLKCATDQEMIVTFEETAIGFPLMEGTLAKRGIRFQSPHIANTHSLNGCTQVPFIFAFGHLKCATDQEMTATFEVTAIEFPLTEGTLGKPCIRFQSPHIANTHSLIGCTQLPFIFAFGHLKCATDQEMTATFEVTAIEFPLM